MQGVPAGFGNWPGYASRRHRSFTCRCGARGGGDGFAGRAPRRLVDRRMVSGRYRGHRDSKTLPVTVTPKGAAGVPGGVVDR
jgi:hypothetical protein